MCRSLRGLMFGCLLFSITYVLVGIIQVTVGIVFMLYIHVFRLASNIWTGGLNIILGGAVTVLICLGQATLNKHRICLIVSVAVVVINLINLLVLEICEWRAFLPPERIQNIVREHKTDLLLAAYLSSTVSTAVALVVGFVACEYIYCLLIAASARHHDELKSQSKRRGFPCRNRRASWYEPISFSWVFEASDHFNSSQSAAQTKSLNGGSKKVCHETNDENIIQHPSSYVITRDKNCGSASSFSANLMSTCSNEITTISNKKNTVNGSAPQIISGRVGIDSKSSSGYSSPDWWTQRYNAKNLSHQDGSFDNHYENIDFCHLSHPHLLQNYPLMQRDYHALKFARHKREVCSLVQLPVYHSEHLHNGMVPVTSSPVKRSTLPSRGYRKRALVEKDENKIKSRYSSGKSPRKRFKPSSESFSDSYQEPLYPCSFKTPFQHSHQQRKPQLSSSPDLKKRDIMQQRSSHCMEKCFTENSGSGSCRECHKYTRSAKKGQSIQSKLDVPSSTNPSVRSSSEQMVIFDVTAEYQTSILSLVPPGSCESSSQVSYDESSNDSSLAIGICITDEEDNDKMENSIPPSVQGSLTSVTGLEDNALSPLSDGSDDYGTLHANSKTADNSGSDCGSNFKTLTPTENKILAPNDEIEENDEDDDAESSKSDRVNSPINDKLSTGVHFKDDEKLSSEIKEMPGDAKAVDETTGSLSVTMNGLPCISLQAKCLIQGDSISVSPVPTLVPEDGPSISSFNAFRNSTPEVINRHSKLIDSENLHGFLKKNGKKTRNNTWSPVFSKHLATNDGISLQSLDRNPGYRLIGNDLTNSNLTTYSDPLLHWKATDNPRLNPVQLVDTESLVSLSNLELLARQWHTYSLHK